MNPSPLEFEKPILELQEQLDDLERRSATQEIDLSQEVSAIQEKLHQTRHDIYKNLTAWQRVQIARHTARPYTLDYVRLCCSEFIELHGDRHIGDDHAMPCGLATFGGIKCMLIGQQKGRDTKENILRNFGCAHPEGYRKAMRLMRLAERSRLPIITLIDTPGAYPGIQSEERNIAEAIAYNLREMMTLTVPSVAVVIGEGGSGGALGIGIANSVLMLENAYYSVISPEGCAAILWKHRQHAPEAAEALKLTATSLKEFAIVDEVIPEPIGGAHYNHAEAAANLQSVVVKHLQKLGKLSPAKLTEQRYQKFRKYGAFESQAPAVMASPELSTAPA